MFITDCPFTDLLHADISNGICLNINDLVCEWAKVGFWALTSTGPGDDRLWVSTGLTGEVHSVTLKN